MPICWSLSLSPDLIAHPTLGWRAYFLYDAVMILVSLDFGHRRTAKGSYWWRPTNIVLYFDKPTPHNEATPDGGKEEGGRHFPPFNLAPKALATGAAVNTKGGTDKLRQATETRTLRTICEFSCFGGWGGRIQ